MTAGTLRVIFELGEVKQAGGWAHVEASLQIHQYATQLYNPIPCIPLLCFNTLATYTSILHPMPNLIFG